MGKRFEKEYEVHYYEVEYRLNCTITSIMDYFCDIGGKQSEELGVGIEHLTERNLAWVFYKYNIKVHRYPKYGEKIRISTIASGFKKFYASRSYEILDENNEKIVEGQGVFLLIDLERRRAVRIPEEYYITYGIDRDVENQIDISKLEKMSEPMHLNEFKVRYSDIDSNKHVNNSKYVEWAIESIPLEIVLNYEMKDLSIIFTKECSYGTIITSVCEVKEESEDKLVIIHKIEDADGKELTSLISKWEKTK